MAEANIARAFLAFVLFSGALAGVPVIWAGTALPTTIDFPGASGTRAYGLNNAGEIVGYYYGASPGNIAYHGFLLADGRFTTIDYPGSYGTEAYGINAAGHIVGVYWDANGAAVGRHGFLFANGRFTTIDVPRGVNTMAYGISDDDQIVGVYTVKSPPAIPGWAETFGDTEYQYDYGHGFVYKAGRFTTIDAPGARRGQQTKVRGINAAGQIVGDYVERAGHNHGFVLTMTHGWFALTTKNFTNVDAPDARSTSATGINAAGQIVGNFAYNAGYGPGFLLADGHFTKIDFKNDSFVGLPQAEGINDAGQIVGHYQVADHGRLFEHGFALNGIP